MNLLPTLLWKEWRDHRAALIGYCVGVPPLIAWGLSALSAVRRVDPLLPSAAAVGGFAIAALTLFGDLFAGEEQRGTMKLLRRLPCGLAPVFVAKFSFMLLAALLMSGWGYFATSAAAALLYGAPFAPRSSLPTLAWLTLVFPLAAWIPAAAIWLSRATLALPAATLTLALFAAPIGVAAWLHPGMKPMPTELLTAFILVTIAGPLVAGASFVLGRRRTTRAFAPAKVGLLATLLLFTPAYAWTGVRVARHLRIDPALASFRLFPSAGVLDRHGGYAYVSGFHRAQERDLPGSADDGRDPGDSPLHALAIDLEAGTWREIGPTMSQFCAPGMPMACTATTVVGLFEPSAFDGLLHSESPRMTLLDAATSQPLDSTFTAEVMRQSGERASELWRTACSVQLPDGRRAWRQDDQLFVDPGRPLPDSRFADPPRFWSFPTAGLGVRLGQQEWYDPLRERRFHVGDDLWIRFVRAGRWIVHDLSKTGMAGMHVLYDPETLSRAPIAGSTPQDSLVDLASDGRLLIVTNRGTRVARDLELALLDPESGARSPLEWPAALDRGGAYVRLAGRTPSGAALLRIESVRNGVCCFARLDLAAGANLVVSASLELSELIGANDEESLVAIEAGRRLVRVRFDGAPPELLFPR